MPLGAFKAALMGTAGVSTGDVVLLHDTDYSNTASADITSGITSTYGEYIFKFYNINPATDDEEFTFQVNAAGGSGFNETITSTHFWAYNLEDDSTRGMNYNTAQDQAQGTAYQTLATQLGNGSDESLVGVIHLFSPASTTYVKHFYSRTNSYYSSPASTNQFTAGYINTTAAIDDVSFKMSSGNLDGVIQMYGIA